MNFLYLIINPYCLLIFFHSITQKAQRIWNQELRNQLTTCNLNHNNYSKAKYNFIPILTSLDHDHQLHFSTKLNSLMYQFAYISLTDPCLLFVKEMNINGFLYEQNIYGFSPISLLCQSMMCHSLSRISGMLVEVIEVLFVFVCLNSFIYSIIRACLPNPQG